jgi:thioredoxin reductase (NADPH)
MKSSAGQKKVDVLVIGAGPIGLACGVEAKRRGFSCRVVEKGCLVNSIYNYPANMTFFSTADRLEIGDVPFISHGDKPNRREAMNYYRRVSQSWDLDVRTYERVLSLDGAADDFRVITDRGTHRARAVIAATGYYDTPKLMNIPGEEQPKVKHYYDEPHRYAYQDVAVIGGGNSAVDVALETCRCGARVTLVVQEAGFKKGVKYWVLRDIENRIKEGEIQAFFESGVERVGERDIILRTPRGPVTLANDFVLAMTGYVPDYSLLEKLGVAVGDDPYRSPSFDKDSFESNVPGLFLAGVVCGGMETSKWFIENSREHPGRIFDQLAKRFEANRLVPQNASRISD